jgi:ribosome-associated protein
MKILEMAQKAAAAASDKKAENIVILEVGPLTSFTDYFVICEAPSDRQVQAIAQNVLDDMSAMGLKPLGVEGMEAGEWALLDFGDFVVHVFESTVRHHYNLEGFWSQAQKIPCAF